MPVHKDFHGMLDGMTEQYCTGEDEDTTKTETTEGYPGKTCRKALGVFYATCKEKGLDYTKPMPKEKVREHVSVVLPFQVLEKLKARKRVKEQDECCVFLWNRRKYGLLVVLTVSRNFLSVKARKKELLEHQRKMREQQAFEPIIAGEYILGFYQDAALFLPEHFRTVWLDKENGILAVFGKLRAEPETERVQSIFFAKEKMWDQTKIQDWLSIHPDYMAPAGDSAVGKAPLIERGNMKKKVKEQNQGQGEPKTDKQRFMDHFSIDEDAFQKLYDILGDELFKLLPERGQKVTEQNGEGNLTVD